MQAQHYINIMGKGGNNKGVMNANQLIAEAAADLNPKPGLSGLNGSADVKEVIRNAFVEFDDTGMLASMTDKQRTNQIIIPALWKSCRRRSRESRISGVWPPVRNCFARSPRSRSFA